MGCCRLKGCKATSYQFWRSEKKSKMQNKYCFGYSQKIFKISNQVNNIDRGNRQKPEVNLERVFAASKIIPAKLRKINEM